MPLTVRLTPKTERKLDALARHRRWTRSQVVRAAIEHYAETQARPAGDDSVYSAWADVIGIAALDSPADGRTTGERFAEIVRAKARARRAR